MPPGDSHQEAVKSLARQALEEEERREAISSVTSHHSMFRPTTCNRFDDHGVRFWVMTGESDSRPEMRTGTFDFSEKTHPSEWRLGSGTGHRIFRATIKFPEAFPVAPRLAVALTGVDSSNTTNLRVGIEAQDIEMQEFDLVVNTWDDTLIFGITGVWIAE